VKVTILFSQGGYILTFDLLVCVLVSNIAQKLRIGFQEILGKGMALGQETSG